jgi:integrase/recombinase XerD
MSTREKRIARSVERFLAWVEKHGKSTDLARITPRMVREYLTSLNCTASTKKLRLSALRHFFDVCVTRHVVLLNPALSVRGERYSQVEGRTPEISKSDCRELLKSIDRDKLMGKRDVALLSMLIYTAARVGAVAGLTVGDFYYSGSQWVLHFKEKGGKSREIPVRHDFQIVLSDYMNAADIHSEKEKDEPLFRTWLRKEKRFSRRAITRIDIYRMLRRRSAPANLGCRSAYTSLYHMQRQIK